MENNKLILNAKKLNERDEKRNQPPRSDSIIGFNFGKVLPASEEAFAQRKIEEAKSKQTQQEMGPTAEPLERDVDKSEESDEVPY